MPALSDSLEGRLAALPANDDWGVQTAGLLIESCAETGCSDLHLLPQRDRLLARARRDGGLVHLASLPMARAELLISRFKVLSRLPSFVKHEPQDGRIEWKSSAGVSRILRVSFLPTLHGETMVLRFPEAADGLLKLEALGMSPDVETATRRVLTAQEGVILVTGPSGSGKTTTLYAMMQHLFDARGDRLNFLTIEDPIERDLGFAAQVQVNDAQGLSFERALRSGLRQDPNVLLIGEIRDLETARIAAQAGMTGHLVLSTVHAGRAARVFTRLYSMGLEPYLIASAFCAAMAQRLARTLCTSCLRSDADRGWIAEGCEDCQYTGAGRRAAVFELLLLDETLRELILSRASGAEFKLAASSRMNGDLIAGGRNLLDQGIISRAEFECAFAFDQDSEQ